MPTHAGLQGRDLGPLILEFKADREALGRLYPLPSDPLRIARFRKLYSDWQVRVSELEIPEEETIQQVEQILLQKVLRKEIGALDGFEQRLEGLASFLPFASQVYEIAKLRRTVSRIPARHAARLLDDLAKLIPTTVPDAEVALRVDAADQADKMLEAVTAWYEFWKGYDPEFTWWVQSPYQAVEKGLAGYIESLREGTLDTVGGYAVGREALVSQLELEMISYTPEELIEIGRREFAWCEQEMKVAAAQLGFGDDWKAALEHVKDIHVAPGEQPGLVYGLAEEAIQYVKVRELVTVPPLAEETWRMSMMSPEAQKVNPFFLGGEEIIVSYPTDSMTHQQKMMSMRGNATHLSRATVQHELIPGHHLQMFMLERHRSYREVFETCFWIEGWTLYWELMLWDMEFPRGAADRIGMLFWRMHRCARIEFSLQFHLGHMTAQECVDFLVERVGFERANAEGEVRRSFKGDYPPLYQAAYMIGGLQVRALREELVDTRKMTECEFHDAILHENQMPWAAWRMLHARVPVEESPCWRFYAGV